jgi:3-dehydroquinate synthetase
MLASVCAATSSIKSLRTFFDRSRSGADFSWIVRISERTLGLAPPWRERTRETLARHGLPVRMDPSVDVAEVIEIMSRDKKSDGRALNMVLLRAPGDVLTHQDPDPAVVRDAVEELLT